MKGKCKICGCTENNACYHPDFGSCWWLDESQETCSHCIELENFPGVIKPKENIDDIILKFTHLWVDGFGWKTTEISASDFDKVLKMPINDKDGSHLFMAYNFDEENQKTETRKFKGTNHMQVK